MSKPEPIFDRTLLLSRSLRAARLAGDGPRPDFLLVRAAEDILWRLGAIKRQFENAAVIGPDRDVVAERLRSARNVAGIATIDLTPDERLDAAPQSLDLIVSALSLQWVDDLPGVLVQIRRALKPDGLMIAAMMGGRTLHELRDAFLQAEAELEGGASPRVAPFADVRDLGSLLQRARFALPVTDVDTVEVTYADPLALMLELRAMGAGNVLVARRRAPLRRATLGRAIETYRQRHGLENGRVRATFEIMTLTGWAPHESQQKPLRPGSAKSRLADALGTRELKAGDTADGTD